MRRPPVVGNVETRLLYDVGMTERTLTVPQILFIAGTRVALGAGVGLLISRRIDRDTRKAAGLALLTFGIVTTIPIVFGILRKRPATREQVILAA